VQGKEELRIRERFRKHMGYVNRKSRLSDTCHTIYCMDAHSSPSRHNVINVCIHFVNVCNPTRKTVYVRRKCAYCNGSHRSQLLYAMISTIRTILKITIFVKHITGVNRLRICNDLSGAVTLY